VASRDQDIRVDLAGKIVVVTGANTGIGLEIARGLALLRAHVVLACRNAEKAAAAREDIANDTCNDNVTTMQLDTSSTSSIRAFAKAFGEKHDRLDVLVNNAGVYLPTRQVTEDGVERTWATNVLGYFTLTNELLPLLRTSAPSRIVNVSSAMARSLDLGDVQFERRRYAPREVYAQSKQAERMLTWALDRRLEGSRVYANAIHPGSVDTAMPRGGGGLERAVVDLYFRFFGKTPAQGADTAVWAAASDECSMSHGNFYANRKIIRCRFRDEAKEEALWSLCEKMVGA